MFVRGQRLYPRPNEVHQLLAKAAAVQRQHPELPVVPLLICRRGHDRLFWMAKDLGFLVHAARAQCLTLSKKTTERQVEQGQREPARSSCGVLKAQIRELRS